MRVFRPLAVIAVACAAVLTAVPAPAWAHNELRASNPAKGAQLASAPAEVVLDFAERLNPKFTTVAVTDKAGAAVGTGQPEVTGPRAVQRLRQPLDAGDYTVAYRVVSVDGHPVSGKLTFTVTAPPPATAPVSPSAATQPSTGPDPTAAPAGATASPSDELPGELAGDESTTEGGGSLVPGLLLAGVAVLAIGTGFLLIRRRRTTQP
ncbi:copper resistance CopC family protein [Micromonospora sp. NBC_01796]|uniref:copper resistance CopC family protein n=1 Tax=Micromonospora sp. NBC_01796 TaxID=2975987 RepID=UPI002DDA5913|nr:copper resistance CopC family protein [Micromonospora sp. NBC_01796]WSA89515.1 copper resistance protein CopC [Micromonospora sp. NBC_01796]